MQPIKCDSQTNYPYEQFFFNELLTKMLIKKFHILADLLTITKHKMTIKMSTHPCEMFSDEQNCYYEQQFITSSLVTNKAFLLFLLVGQINKHKTW